MSNKNQTEKRLAAGIFAIIVLAVCLCITTFALVYATLWVDNNLFRTGGVKLNLNDGAPVIEEYEYLFEPGMTVVKDFFLENQSTGDVYYKLYFENVEGDLAEVLDVDILWGEKVLYSGKMTELTKKTAGAAEDILLLNERRVLQIRFHFPENAGNEAQNMTLTFDLSAEAVQTKNNPDRVFD